MELSTVGTETWADCEARGLAHDPVPEGDGRTIRSNDGTHLYVACNRCPVTIRRTAPERECFCAFEPTPAMCPRHGVVR